MNQYDIEMELIEIKNLLFFVQDSLDGLETLKRKYDMNKKESDKRLAFETSRCVDPLISLNLVILKKVNHLQKEFGKEAIS